MSDQIEIKIAGDPKAQHSAAKLFGDGEPDEKMENDYIIKSIIFEKSGKDQLKIVAMKMFSRVSQVGFTAYPICPAPKPKSEGGAR